MPRSMTGHGQAKCEGPWGALQVEVRTVNHRGLKIISRLGEALSCYETKVESLVRESVERGTVHLNARWQRKGAAASQVIDTQTLGHYYRQLNDARSQWPDAAPIDLTRLVQLPGVLTDSHSQETVESEVVEALLKTVQAAIANLNEMRAIEGRAMETSLREDLAEVVHRVESIEGLVPTVVDLYRGRLRAKVDSYLAENELQVSIPEVLREVQLFADRADISEEITRLRSHLVMFEEGLGGSAARGRKLDFVVQEMFRETNTIGSKASDAQISAHVVEIKCALERIRELVQNIE